MRRAGWLIVVCLVFTGWARSRFEPVAVVLSVQGKTALTQPERIARPPLKVLSTIHMGDRVILSPGARVTLTVLATGVRYGLTGPLNWEVKPDRPLQPGRGVQELPRQPGREALSRLERQPVDLMPGDTSSRGVLGHFYVDDEAPPLVDLDLIQQQFESSTLTVSVRPLGQPDWSVQQASLIHHSNGPNQLRLGGLRLAEGEGYQVFLGDGDPHQGGSVVVYRPTSQQLGAIRDLEKLALDLPAQIELYQSYLHLRLYARAAQYLEHLTQLHPQLKSGSGR